MAGSVAALGPLYSASPLGNIMPLVYPSGIEPGDVAVYMFSQSIASFAFTDAPPLTELWRHASSSDGVQPNAYVYASVMDGSEDGATINMTAYNANSLGRIHILRGVDTNLANVQIGAWTQPNSGPTVSVAGLTVPAPGSVLMYLATQNSTQNTYTITSTPGAWTKTIERVVGINRTAAAGYLEWSGSGATGSPTITWSGSARSNSVMFAFPAAAAPAVDQGKFFQFL